jgi:hypothetical protein
VTISTTAGGGAGHARETAGAANAATATSTGQVVRIRFMTPSFNNQQCSDALIVGTKCCHWQGIA